MTPVTLLDELQAFIEDATKDILLHTKATQRSPEGGERAAEVWKMCLPDKNSETQRAPYIILQVVNGLDDQAAGDDQESTCNIRFVICVYSDDNSEGALAVLNIISRIRIALERQRVVGNLFTLRLPVEYLVYTDQPAPFFLGEMMTVWELPNIEREVNMY